MSEAEADAQYTYDTIMELPAEIKRLRKEWAEVCNEYGQMRAERDELLAALKPFVSLARIKVKDLDRARAAVAKAERAKQDAIAKRKRNERWDDMTDLEKMNRLGNSASALVLKLFQLIEERDQAIEDLLAEIDRRTEKRLHAEIERVRAERDELLARLRGALPHVENEGDDSLATMIRAAIAKAEGK